MGHNTKAGENKATLYVEQQSTYVAPTASDGDLVAAVAGPNGGLRIANIFPAGSETALVHDEIDSLANGSAQITNWIACNGVANWRLRAKVTTGTSPTVNTLLEFYLATSDNESGGKLVDAGLTYNASASASTSTDYKNQLTPLGSIVVTASSDVTYTKSFDVEVLGAHHFAIVVYNETGAALNSTVGNHDLRLYTAG
jgi:hypothetical protein